jgi:hypothetical protein
MLTDDRGKTRQGVDFFCTDVDEGVCLRRLDVEVEVADDQDGAFSYQYKLKPGVNTNSHAIVSII